MKSVSFAATPSGDGECFCFQVTTETYRRVLGEENYQDEIRLNKEIHEEDGFPLAEPTMIYPGEILHALGHEGGEGVFTVSVGSLDFDNWCKAIADNTELDRLIKHFREHVCEHFDRHDRSGFGSLKIWLIGVLNFAAIFHQKFPDISQDDLLFKLCTYHINHPGDGPEPPFDIEAFMAGYNGFVTAYQAQKNDSKT